jgi:hypothetical protein
LIKREIAAANATIFGFIQVGRHEFAQSWGAHIFVDGTVEYFFDPTHELFDDEMILINGKYFLFFATSNTGLRSLLVVFSGFIGHRLEFPNANTITWAT